MKFTRKHLILGLGMLLVSLGVYAYMSGFSQNLMRQITLVFSQPSGQFDPTLVLNKPADQFDPSLAGKTPDYADSDYWAALPNKQDPADLIPAGIADDDIQGQAPVDVFFIHPTGLLSGGTWTSPLNPASATEENTQWSMAYQASAFNGCCNIYAPQYREASIFSYTATTVVERDRILDFAYQDVAAAFEHFIRHYNAGRPFIIASHSQGTHHALRLLKERIDNTPLREQLVVAYVTGSTIIGVSQDWLAGLVDIKACQSASQLACINHWDTAAEEGVVIPRRGDTLCTNPLTWEASSTRGPAELHRGALPILSAFNNNRDPANPPENVTFTALAAPLPHLTWAECRDGTLRVAAQSSEVFAKLRPGQSYHILDYPLFYMNVRENAKLRVKTFLASRRTGHH